MKILHLSSESSWRGGEQQIAYLIEELETMGIEPLVACKPDSEFESFCRQKGWAHYPLQMKSSSDLKSGRDLKRLCKQLSVDILHAHSSHSHSAAFLAYLFGNRVPVVLTRRVDFKLKNNPFSRFKYTFPGIQRIVCVSDAIRKIVVRGTDEPTKCTTIHSAINHCKFEPYIGADFLRREYKLDSDLTLIGNTSAIAPHKDYFTFVDSAQHYIEHFDHKVRFFIIGEGEQEAEIKAYIKHHNLDGYFILTGFLKNIAEVLPSLDIFFISSKTEGLGTSVIDAFAARVPVVATNAGGIPELVKNENTGLLAEVKDAVQLAQNLFTLKQNSRLREQIVESAYQHSLQFNTQAMAASYSNLYQEVLSVKQV
ncbi:MAG: glycosyltransferase [Verrucomicrobia bacterium]|jgi:glycosyltransferase involved in cell wall biosynthesis|nr:glycosyltransferase [Verrucomicrobiota bacterium]